MLARIRKAMEEKDEGFTLIELLVVIIIIGILAAIAIPVFLNQRKKGFDSQAKSDLRNFASAEETYFTEGNEYGTVLKVHTDKSPVKLSADTTIHVYLNAATKAQAWCATSTAVGSGSGAVYAYKSDGGGLQAGTAGNCTGYSTDGGELTISTTPTTTP